MILHVDGRTLAVGLGKASPALAKAGQRERETFTVSPADYGIHWPMLDEDLQIAVWQPRRERQPDGVLSHVDHGDPSIQQ